MGKIFTITGVSGAGKSTLARGFTLAIPGAKLIISITTRTPRVGDLHGEYSHVSVDEFRELEHEGKFLWTAQYGCTHYGTLVGAVDDVVASSTAVGVMILSPPGVRDLRHHLESGGDIGVHTPVFVTAPPRDELVRRLTERGENERSIGLRLSQSGSWDAEAHADGTIRYTFIQNIGDPSIALGHMLTLFR